MAMRDLVGAGNIEAPQVLPMTISMEVSTEKMKKSSLLSSTYIISSLLFLHFLDRRGYPPSKGRHHSLDDEYYSAYYGYYGNGYSGWCGNGNFRSQPSLNGRDGPPGKFGGGPRYPPPVSCFWNLKIGILFFK